MLQSLHHMVRGWLAWVIMALVAVTFVLLGVGVYQGARVAKPIVEVNGDPIYAYQLTDAIRRQADVGVKPIDASSMRRRVLADLVYQRLRDQVIGQQGFAVSEQQIRRAIQSLPDFQEDGHFSPQRLNQVLSANQLQAQGLMAAVAQGMLVNQQRFVFAATNFVLPNELDAFFRYADQQRTYRYLHIDDKALEQPTIADKDVAQYFQQHRRQLKTQPQISLAYVELSLTALKHHLNVTEDQRHQFYQDNRANFTTAKRYRLQHLFLASEKSATDPRVAKVSAAITAAKPFDELVKQYSDDLQAPQGYLPWLGTGTLPPAVDKHLTTLAVGQVAGPIAVPHGVEFIKLVAVKAPQTASFEQVKSRIQELLINQKAQSQFLKASETLAELSYQYPDSLNEVAQALNLPIKSTVLFAKNQRLPPPFNHHKGLKKTVWSEDIYGEGNNSTPVELSKGHLVVLRVKEKQPAHELTLTQATPLIRQRLTEQALSQALKKLTIQLTSAIAKGHDQVVDKLMLAHKLKWTKTSLTRGDIPNPAMLDPSSVAARIAFDISANETTKAVTHQPVPSGGEVIVNLLSITDGKGEQLDAARQALVVQQLQSRLGVERYQRYLALLLKDARIQGPDAAGIKISG